MIPQFVPSDQLVRVNGFFGSFQAVTAVLAPAIAGAVMATSPLGYIFIVDLVTAAIGIALFLAFVRVRQDHVNPDNRTGQWSELKSGFRYLVGHDYLGRFMVYSILGAFFASPLLVVVNLHMVRMFGDEPWRLSVMEAIFGVALIFGGLFVGIWPGFKRETTTIGMAMLVMSVLCWRWRGRHAIGCTWHSSPQRDYSSPMKAPLLLLLFNVSLIRSRWAECCPYLVPSRPLCSPSGRLYLDRSVMQFRLAIFWPLLLLRCVPLGLRSWRTLNSGRYRRLHGIDLAICAHSISSVIFCKLSSGGYLPAERCPLSSVGRAFPW